MKLVTILLSVLLLASWSMAQTSLTVEELAELGDIRYSAVDGENTVTWTVSTNQLSQAEIRVWARGGQQIPNLVDSSAAILERVLDEHPPQSLRTLFFGRFDALLSQRLVLAAHNSPAWKESLCRGPAGELNKLVAKLIKSGDFLAEWQELFARFGLTLTVDRVEKVLCSQGPAAFRELNRVPQDEILPFESMLWLNISEVKPSAYEPPPVLNAEQILQPELLASEYHRIDSEVINDGYLNTYRIVSDFGEFIARGTPMLAVRVHEVHALAQIDELSKTKVFLKAISDGATGQVDTIFEFGKHPVRTVVGIPAGVGRMFKRYSRRAKDAADKLAAVADSDDGDGDGENPDEFDLAGTKDQATGLVKRYSGVSSAERGWAARLGTDPYSSNETLTKAIAKVAWVERAGSLGFKLAAIPAIPGVSYIRKANRIATSSDPNQLRDRNTKLLGECGADDDLIVAFFANPWISPTQQTWLVELTSKLAGLAGAETLIERASVTESEVQARFLIASIEMLEYYHRTQTPVEQVLPGSGVPFVLDADGRLVVFAAVDHLCWTPAVAEFVRARTAELGAEQTSARAAWFLGTASPRCRRELRNLGWEVHENLSKVVYGPGKVETTEAPAAPGAIPR